MREKMRPTPVVLDWTWSYFYMSTSRYKSVTLSSYLSVGDVRNEHISSLDFGF